MRFLIYLLLTSNLTLKEYRVHVIRFSEQTVSGTFGIFRPQRRDGKTRGGEGGGGGGIPVREVSGDSARKIRIRAESQSIEKRGRKKSPTGMPRGRILRRRRKRRRDRHR